MLKQSLIALSVMAASAGAFAGEHNFLDGVKAKAFVESDDVHRGVSQAGAEGSLGAKVSAKLVEGVYGSVKVQTANFDGVGHDGVNSTAELKLGTGYVHNDVTFKGAVVHHMFMGDDSENLGLEAADLNYTAVGAKAEWKEYSFGVAYTNDVYGLSNYLETATGGMVSGEEVSEVVYSLGYDRHLANGHLSAELNFVELGETEVTESDSYTYFRVGYMTEVAENTKLSVDYHHVDGGEKVEAMLGSNGVFVDNQVTASLSYKF